MMKAYGGFLRIVCFVMLLLLTGTSRAVAQQDATADAAAWTERDFTVGSDEWALPGTLTLPAGDGPFAAVVLVHGSGALDRDETVLSNKPFRDLAHDLAARGIAVLRYDKRNFAHSTKFGTVITRYTVADETIDDAALAVEALTATPSIARDRIFVLGHSLGGMLVPRIAIAAPGAAGFIVLAGPTRPLEQIIPEQLEYLARLDGVVAPEEQAQIDGVRSLATRVRSLEVKDAESSEWILGFPAAYWLDLRGYDPPEAAKAITRPMLVLQGERDYQVTMEEFGRWKAALDGRTHVTFKSYPTLNHLFMPGFGPGTPTEYYTPSNVAEEVVRDIADWIAGLVPTATPPVP